MNREECIDFNSEVIWGSDKPLFDIYFKEKFFNDRFRYTFYTIPENISFDDALDLLKYV